MVAGLVAPFAQDQLQGAGAEAGGGQPGASLGRQPGQPGRLQVHRQLDRRGVHRGVEGQRQPAPQRQLASLFDFGPGVVLDGHDTGDDGRPEVPLMRLQDASGSVSGVRQRDRVVGEVGPSLSGREGGGGGAAGEVEGPFKVRVDPECRGQVGAPERVGEGQHQLPVKGHLDGAVGHVHRDLANPWGSDDVGGAGDCEEHGGARDERVHARMHSGQQGR